MFSLAFNKKRTSSRAVEIDTNLEEVSGKGIGLKL